MKEYLLSGWDLWFLAMPGYSLCDQPLPSTLPVPYSVLCGPCHASFPLVPSCSFEPLTSHQWHLSLEGSRPSPLGLTSIQEVDSPPGRLSKESLVKGLGTQVRAGSGHQWGMVKHQELAMWEECVSHGLKQQQEKQMSVPAESWAVEGISGSNGHPGSSLWALGSQRTNKQRHHCRKAMTCPRRVSQKPWEEITISLPPSMSCASGGHWYNLISFQYHSCKGFWEFFFFFF